MTTAPIQKRQSRCIRLQYGPGSGSPVLLLFPSGLCLFPVILSPYPMSIRHCAAPCCKELDSRTWPDAWTSPAGNADAAKEAQKLRKVCDERSLNYSDNAVPAI